MAEPFDVCWDRMARAETHRAAIAGSGATLLSRSRTYRTCWYATTARARSASSNYTKCRKRSRSKWANLYQMRAALDGCVYEAACLMTGQRSPPNENQLEFPICMTLDVFEQSAQRKLGPFKKPQRDAIAGLQHPAVQDARRTHSPCSPFGQRSGRLAGHPHCSPAE